MDGQQSRHPEVNFLNAPVAQRVAPEEWEFYKDIIMSKYDTKKLAVVVKEMRDEYHFVANERQMVYHLKIWDRKKSKMRRATSAKNPQSGEAGPEDSTQTFVDLLDATAQDPPLPNGPCEVANTDSGYGSVSKPGPGATGIRETADLKVEDEREDTTMRQPECIADEIDAQTEYSAATTTAEHQIDVYMRELSADIYGKVRRHVSTHEWPVLCEMLPDLIKGFAVKLGRDDSHISRVIMYFIHKHHRQLITHLEDLFSAAANDDPVENDKDNSDVMPLHDKILLWINMQGAKPPVVHEGDAFVGVVEDEEDPMTDFEQVEFQRYFVAIYRSASYEWFIRTVCKHARLHAPESPHGASLQDSPAHIHDTVLRQFPSGKISKRRPPPIHRATFRIRRDWNQYKGMDQQMLHQIHQVVVATGCAGEMQITTVAEYVRQTWPSGGEEFANSFLTGIYKFAPCPGLTTSRDDIERSGLRPDEVFVDTLPDKTRVAVGMDCGNVFVTVDGTSYSIAECGEELGWLSAVLFGRPPISISTPTNHCYYVRPEVVPLEVSLPDILSISDSAEGNLHLLTHDSPKRLEIKFSTRTAETRWERVLQPLQSDDLQPMVVGGYPVARRPDNISALDLSSRALLRKLGGFGISLFQKHVELKLPGTNLYLVKKTEFNASPKSSEGGDSQLATPSSSSLDPDMLSVPSQSDDGWGPTRASFGLRVFRRIFYRLLKESPRHWQCGLTNASSQKPTTRGSGAQGSSASTAYPGATPRSNGLGRKRARGGVSRDQQGRDEDCDGDDDPRGGKKPRVTTPDGQKKSRFLACPFWKWDQSRHHECFAKKLDTIGHLKQHLKRKHTPKFYCVDCFTTFNNGTDHHVHVQKAKCVKSQSAALTGIHITHQQGEMLVKKASQGSDEEKWHQIWAILFPDDSPPTSIYLDSDLSEIFCRVLEYSQTRDGVSIVRDEILATGGVVVRDSISDTQLTTAVQRGLQLMFEQFLVQVPSGQTSNATSNSNSAIGTSYNANSQSGPSRSQVAQTPLTPSEGDSGVVMSSGFRSFNGNNNNSGMSAAASVSAIPLTPNILSQDLPPTALGLRDGHTAIDPMAWGGLTLPPTGGPTFEFSASGDTTSDSIAAIDGPTNPMDLQEHGQGPTYFNLPGGYRDQDFMAIYEDPTDELFDFLLQELVLPDPGCEPSNTT
ncbi:hypothetical protein OQA88_7064 [Cercophora sp. LCS_1]